MLQQYPKEVYFRTKQKVLLLFIERRQLYQQLFFFFNCFDLPLQPWRTRTWKILYNFRPFNSSRSFASVSQVCFGEMREYPAFACHSISHTVILWLSRHVRSISTAPNSISCFQVYDEKEKQQIFDREELTHDGIAISNIQFVFSLIYMKHVVFSTLEICKYIIFNTLKWINYVLIAHHFSSNSFFFGSLLPTLNLSRARTRAAAISTWFIYVPTVTFDCSVRTKWKKKLMENPILQAMSICFNKNRNFCTIPTNTYSTKNG